MNSREFEEYIESLTRIKDKLVASKSKSLKFFIDAGILTKSGNLTANYSRTPPKVKR